MKNKNKEPLKVVQEESEQMKENRRLIEKAKKQYTCKPFILGLDFECIGTKCIIHYYM